MRSRVMVQDSELNAVLCPQRRRGGWWVAAVVLAVVGLLGGLAVLHGGAGESPDAPDGRTESPAERATQAEPPPPAPCDDADAASVEPEALSRVDALVAMLRPEATRRRVEEQMTESRGQMASLRRLGEDCRTQQNMMIGGTGGVAGSDNEGR
jgi:hypothetical protein